MELGATAPAARSGDRLLPEGISSSHIVSLSSRLIATSRLRSFSVSISSWSSSRALSS